MVDVVYLVDEVDAETMRRVVDDGRRALHINIYANTPFTQPNTRHREALSHSEQNTPMTGHGRRQARAFRRQPWLLGPCPLLREPQNSA